jgi:hypothetical protein
VPTCSCGKRLFASACTARRLHSRASFRLRVYECPERKGWHVVANADKRRALEPSLGHRRKHRDHALAPVRTLAEVEQMAAERRARGC